MAINRELWEVSENCVIIFVLGCEELGDEISARYVGFGKSTFNKKALEGGVPCV